MTRAATDYSRCAFAVADLDSSIDGTPRMMDLTLAEALEFSRPRDIRKIVERHMQALRRFGEVCATVARTLKNKDNSGGRPGKAYYLNKKQALYICTKSETDNATEVTIQMVEVFDAYTAGQLVATDKPTHVREHDRRTSTKIDDAVRLKTNIDRLEEITTTLRPASHPNLCAMVIDGQPIWADLDSYDMGRGESAVVMKWDGTLAISQVDNFDGSHSLASVRAGLLPSRPSPTGGSQRSVCLIIGKLVGHQNPGFQAAIQQAPPKQIEHKPGRTIYKEKVLELIDRGMGNAEISRELGCCIETVSRLRRQIKDQDYRPPPFASPRFARYRDRVIAMIKQGYGNAEIARTLGCHLHTVERRRAMMNIQARDLLL